MGMIHVRPGRLSDELVIESRTRLDQRLRDKRDTIHTIRRMNSVTMHCRALSHLVGDLQTDFIAFRHPDVFTGYTPVVEHSVGSLARRHFPGALSARDLEN